MSITAASTPLFKNILGDGNMCAWDGKQIEIIGIIANPEDTSECDVLAMPMFKVKLVETSEISHAYVDEIDEQFWPPEMKAVIEGQNAWIVNKKMVNNPYDGELAKHFDYGQINMQHKCE
ncbi:hypothetical protein V6259_12730 [Marinomonas sp. TI.3.20]|uniref:hypothetical protein n=1 Tax=Marinomonas sp. TI.3.20 TaxID=3121296 RepID=UPI00311ECDAB